MEQKTLSLHRKCNPKLNRYFIYLGYSGKNYCGWQVQPNGDTVQQQLENSLSTVLQKNIATTGAGRTDAGVHARLMVAHVDSKDPLAVLPFLAEKLNRLLPKD
ncbi:MAG: tRNA pseudouridine(38-40) synthase TruA, partial [Parabacteroides sp.]|nr:tRNA pseudouridine(38-40) synthase TruA [Parabacteroides sp.]